MFVAQVARLRKITETQMVSETCTRQPSGSNTPGPWLTSTDLSGPSNAVGGLP